MNKRSLYILGFITLLVFPIPTFLGLWFMEGTEPIEIFQWDTFRPLELLNGAILGGGYALLALAILQAKVFKDMPIRIETLVRSMKLTVFDCLFLSICAGVGEELLFRSGVQFYLGPLVTSIIFVAIHGYLNPFNWKMSLYGLIVLPFILLISYGYERSGLWFAIMAHFVYDFILFLSMTRDPNAGQP